jgi:hypothetical protein
VNIEGEFDFAQFKAIMMDCMEKNDVMKVKSWIAEER